MTFLRASPHTSLQSPSSDQTVDTGAWTTDFDSDEERNVQYNNASVGAKNSPNTDDDWRTHPISVFADKYHGESPEDHKLPPKVRKFYKKQNKLIEELQLTVSLLSADGEGLKERNRAARRQQRINNALIKATFFLNLALLVCKLVASILSHSLSVISSLMDSAVDLASGFTLWIAAHQMRKSLPYSYPTGRRRLEPVAVIILSVIMASLSVQIMLEAVQTIYNMAANNQGPPVMSNLTISLVAITIAVKISLFLICWKFGRGESVAALKNDQLNDCLSNSAALIFATISSRLGNAPYLKYFDPSGAILIGCYIIFSWWKMGAEHTRNLTGRSADPGFLQRITFICVNHHPSIERLDTVRAFHLGNNYMVEVDIVLPRNMDLHEAHDIGESLQRKLESLEEVERAFVHLDYEYNHHPQTEHKVF
ncbi:hypothetical protein Aperf_G00000064074 [Anoplocephala perfoliata]